MSDKTSKLRIFFIGDHVLLRVSVARLLSGEPDFDVVGDCSSTPEALQIISGANTDVVLLDIDQDHKKGLDFLTQLKPNESGHKILILSAGMSEAEGAELMKRGAAGIFMKHGSATALAEGIRQITYGQLRFGQKYLRTIFRSPVEAQRGSRNQSRLTKRQRQVLACLSEGLTNRKIADRLNTSEGAVKASLQELFTKIGVRTRSQLIRVAIEWGDQIITDRQAIERKPTSKDIAGPSER